MAKDPICGMYVDEKTSKLKATVGGITYYFCSETCLKTFLRPEVELRNMKPLVAFSIILDIPTLVFTYLPIARVPRSPSKAIHSNDLVIGGSRQMHQLRLAVGEIS